MLFGNGTEWIMDNNMEERLLGSETEGPTDLKWRIWEESKKAWRITFPAMLSRITAFGMLVVTQAFIGHISQLDLSAFALTQTILVRFCNGILVGMSSATETLCGQAFGAKQYHMMGIYLQRSWLVDVTMATIMAPLFIFATSIFKLLGQEDDIAIAVRSFSLWFLPFLYYLVFSMTLQMFLQAQLKNMIVAWVSAASFVLHVLLSWLFVIKLNLGIPGAMSALTISSWSMVIGESVYVFGGWCPKTWRGLSSAAFTDILPVIKLSVSSGFMLCLELWYNAVVLLVAGYLKDASIAISAFSICININTWELMLCLGFVGASCVRVANELGRGNAKAAIFSIKVILCNSILIGVIFWVLCLVFGHDIAYLFTSDEEVITMVSSLSVLLSFSILLNSVQPVLIGVAIGAGWQGAVGIVNVGCYYVVGIPIGALLAYVADLSVRGMWIGVLCGIGMQTLVLTIMTWRTNWDEQVKKTSDHLNKWLLESSESNQNSPQA
ncbi:protein DETOXIFICATION 24 isoform X1 [Vitis vinifera]|uniref:protein DETOXIFICATION 24 isoform X1 n=1 Tax=Vitis vinifera TaxID=29760 RepID=UPI0008FFA583|nr:protein DETOXIFICATION 24 isoform X1 [Vitis vinifera]|eukprot:XP_019076989.1 PREDICTED: protein DETOXIFICATION 24 isoform X1 [Vitis vinifera]